MADSLGPVAIPEPPTISPFPLRVDYGTAKQIEPQVYVHKFDAPGLKTEQRFYRGNGSTRFRVRKWSLECREYESLRDHWDQARGVWAKFLYHHPVDAKTTVDFTVRYGDPVLRFEHLVALATGDPGIQLVAEPDPAQAPIYTSAAISDGRPSDSMAAHLAMDRVRLVPMVRIYPRDGSAPLYCSDRRATIDGSLYLPRLLDWSGLTQSVNQNNDSALFRFGNADGVWTTLVKTLNLQRAELHFGIFLPDYSERLNLWMGYVRDWSKDPASRQISMRAGEGAFELTLPYPTRQITRTCWKEFKSAQCPYTGPLTTCEKSWEQCQERGMTLYFGGIIAKAQDVRVKDNTTGTWGWGRSVMKSVSIAEDSIYQRVLQEIYTDIPMFINCDVATGRDESEFYSALGIVGEGPLLGFSTDLTKHLLDDAPPHDPQKNGGWRGVPGRDPATASYDFFGLSEAPWNTVPPGATYAAGTAFAEIRRTDAKGLQLSKVSDRKMQVLVTGGLGGWVWSGPGARSWQQPLTNCVWVAANVFLRGLGMKADNTRPDAIPAEEMEQWLDLQSIIDSAALCDLMVPKLVGTGSERQFPYRGIIREQKPLRDWLTEILTCCLGYYYFVNGRLAIGIRINSSVLTGDAFTRATVLQNSFAAEPREVSFNHLTAEFADEEFEWSLNSVQVYDIDHAKEIGTPAAPRFTVSRLALSGVSNKSQASRITITRLREELGGTTAAEQSAARATKLRTTAIALGTLPGEVASFDDPDLPGGRVEFRIVSRTLNPDWTMDFEAVPCCNSMYDYTFGPKPDDVPADPVPPERFQSPHGLAWLPDFEIPEINDPMYGTDELTFRLRQEYEISREGVWEAALWSEGEMTVNHFLGYDTPMLYNVTFSTTGGSIIGASVYYIAICQRDGSVEGRFTPPSNIVAIWVPAGTQGKITINTIVPAATAYPGYAVYMGRDVRRMCRQIEKTDEALPTSLELLTFDRQTAPMPWAEARKVRIKTKHVIHSGVAGLLVQDVIGPDRIVSSEWIGSTDNWVGQWLSVLADASDYSVPLWNFRIQAFDPATGTMTVDPPCVRATPEDSVQPGDVMVVRARPTAATASSVTCALWRNSIAMSQFGADGLAPGEEKGLLLRILTGKGAGQTRMIIDNTRDTHTIDTPWEILPDSTSVLIVEAPEWVNTSETSTPEVQRGRQYVHIRTRVANLKDRVVLVGGFLVDDQELETMERFGVYREIYVFGQPPTVRAVETAAKELQQATEEDHVIRVAGTAGSPLILPPLAQYHGRTLLVWNDGPGQATVECAPGDTLYDGNTSLTVEEKETLRITAA